MLYALFSCVEHVYVLQTAEGSKKDIQGAVFYNINVKLQRTFNIYSIHTNCALSQSMVLCC